jgi:Zn-dependent protease
MKDQKTYYSFHDVPFDSRNQYQTVSYETGLKFSQGEIIQILIAMGVLTLAFSFALAPSPPLANLNSVLGNIPIAFLAIATAFVCHEIAHKYMGQKYGYWSEFRMFPQGLLLALFLGVFVGVVFAAPGAVQIFGNPNREESGKMAAAGPATNLTISLISALLFYTSSGYISYIFFFLAYINAFLAFFNLLPFGPLDGMKIFRWRKEVWVLLIILSISIFITLMI